MSSLWLLLGALLVLSGQPEPAPQDYGQPVTVQVELVSLKVEPSSAADRGKMVSGYLGLRPVVADSPTRTVEELEGFGAYAWLPGIRLRPEPFSIPVDGRWHRPVLRNPPAARWGDELPYVGYLRVYPLVRDVGNIPSGSAGVNVWLYYEGHGWTQGQRVWFKLGESSDEKEVRLASPAGYVTAFLRLCLSGSRRTGLCDAARS